MTIGSQLDRRSAAGRRQQARNATDPRGDGGYLTHPDVFAARAQYQTFRSCAAAATPGAM